MHYPFFRKLAPLVFLFQVLSLLYFGWQCAYLKSDNRIERFAVADHAAEMRYREFTEAFEPREHFLVALKFKEGSAQEGAERAETFFAELAKLPGIERYHSLRTLLPGESRYGEETLPFPFFDRNLGIYTGIFEVGWERKELLARLPERVSSFKAKNADLLARLILAGEPILNDHLNHGSLEVRNRFFPILIGCALLLLGLLFRNLKVLLVVGLAVGSGLSMTVGIMVLAHETMDLVTTLIPALVFVLSIAMQMHLLLAIGKNGSVLAGLRRKLSPNFLVALTTSIGFGSLMASYVSPIAVMGKYMAIGIWVIFFWTHVTHLGISLLIDLRIEPPRLVLLERVIFSSRYRRLIRRPLWVLVAVFSIAGGVVTLLLNPSESNALNYFDLDHPIRRDTTFLQENITGASQLELLVQAKEGPVGDLTFIPDWNRIEALEKSLLSLPRVRHIFSVNSFVSFVRDGIAGENKPPPDAVLNLILQWQRAVAAPFLSKEYYRIQILVDALDREEYDKLKREIEQRTAGSGIEARFIITGTLDRVVEIQNYLFDSLSKSLGITIGFILLLMMGLLAGKGRLLIILIPNLFPLGMMALAMGLFRIRTSISSVMVFSIAFGIAVDDTIHLLHTFYHTRQERRFRDRWRFTLEQDARAILLTSLVLTLGFMVLLGSSFIPTADFGVLMAVGMIFAFIGDTLFLPILLRVAALKLAREKRRTKKPAIHGGTGKTRPIQGSARK